MSKTIEPDFRQAPIVGEEGCTRFGDRWAELPVPDPVWAGGFSFTLDLQPDLLSEQVVLGASETNGSRFVLTSNVGDQVGRLRLEIRDAADRWLVADIAASPTLGKRLLLIVRPEESHVAAWELQPWSPDGPVQIEYGRSEGPHDLPGFAHPLILSGLNAEGHREGRFSGRMANFAFFDRPLDASQAPAYRDASLTREPADLPAFRPGALDAEGRETFLEDYDKLRAWREKGTLTRAETRDAAGLAHLWLCDRYGPLLNRFADEYGLQVSLPDLDPMRAYSEKVRELNPVFMFDEDRWAGDWLSPSAFLNDMAFWLHDYGQVSWLAFIKFVRNKLGGGGHFDPEDRKRWQRELNVMIRESKVRGEDWMNVRMFTLVEALSFTAESCGLVALAEAAHSG